MKNESKDNLSKDNRKLKKGFTLVEILIVLALIGIVAGLAMSNLGGIFQGGKATAAQTWVDSTGPAYVNSYLALVGEYPKTLKDLQTPPNGLPPFVKKASDLEDPWGNPYQYTLQGSSFEIFTTDPDGKKISSNSTSN